MYAYDWNGTPTKVGVVFGKWFWAFGPSIKGPTLSIIGHYLCNTYLYKKYMDMLLIAVAYDVDDQNIFCYFFEL